MTCMYIYIYCVYMVLTLVYSELCCYESVDESDECLALRRGFKVDPVITTNTLKKRNIKPAPVGKYLSIHIVI